MPLAIPFFLHSQIGTDTIVLAQQETIPSKPSHTNICSFLLSLTLSARQIGHTQEEKGEIVVPEPVAPRASHREILLSATPCSAVRIASHHPSSRIQDANAAFPSGFSAEFGTVIMTCGLCFFWMIEHEAHKAMKLESGISKWSSWLRAVKKRF
ncbi:hypothetical protein L207DRAFT_510549 [Hyaloscypha variabilis F]|jgi:hypothetical protein|uniref:Uncharacterized protein n=1 Tax=Hyaloscypha variabilis (strain UAMH 11265 / GT02V1 / F) TaxID=1149755 RepID=A0A2J6RUZ8_HYAVF|nr:hypothetical protein L207DRAFT_510549 [Hyaloscypha variabilis F]